MVTRRGAAAARRIAVLGTGYVGLTTGACLCSLGHQVICADVDSGKMSRLARGEVDIREPGLAELLREGKYKPRSSYTVKLTGPLLRDPAAVRVGRNGTTGGS